MKYNVLQDQDSYKYSHYLQYKPGTKSMFSYIESRGGKYPKTVFFGLQYYLKEYFEGVVITEKDVEKAAKFAKGHGVPFNYKGWMRIAKDLGGKLPVRIRAVPEGTVVPTHNILVSIESTDPETFWVASCLETILVRLWYSTTTATISYYVKKTIMDYLQKTCDNPDAEILFKLHDFGSRGVSSQESAAIGGAAHLINFMGSDTIVGVLMANEYYNCDMSSFSIPAAEHSTITVWGKEHEVDAYRNMLKQYAKPGSIVAVVSDSYDIYNACEKIWGEELRQEVIDSGATIVIRPDSGDPEIVVRKVLAILADKFGTTVNGKGFKILNNVRVIQGDGVNPESIKKILAGVVEDGFSAENLSFGMGGGLLQLSNRDDLRFAMKCSNIIMDDETEIDVFKDPITDTVKKSKKGRLDLVQNTLMGAHGGVNVLETVRLNPGEITKENSQMRTVFENGKLLIEDSLDDIRKRAVL